MSNKKAGPIYIMLDGQLTNITDLDREDYEQFLEIIHALRLQYITFKHQGYVKENANIGDRTTDPRTSDGSTS